MKRLIRGWLPALLWMGAIFLVSAQPTVPSVPGRWDLILKKLMHFAAYGVLTYLYMRAMRESVSTDAPIRIISAGLALLYALSDEYHQTFVPGRNGTLVDVGIDAVGVGALILLDAWLSEGGPARAQEASQ